MCRVIQLRTIEGRSDAQMMPTDGGHAAPLSRWCEMSGRVSSEGRNHQRRLRIPQTDSYKSPRFPPNTSGRPEPLWNPFVKSSPRIDTQSQAYTATYVALSIYAELARCGRCWKCSNDPKAWGGGRRSTAAGVWSWPGHRLVSILPQNGIK